MKFIRYLIKMEMSKLYFFKNRLMDEDD